MADIVDTRVRLSPAAASRGTAFDDARRHSRRVRRLKVLVPGLALLGAAGFVAYAVFDPFRAIPVSVDVGTLAVSGDRLTMELPHLTGFNRKQEAYNVTAKSASQRIAAPGLIDLTDLEAVITMQDKTKATLTAHTGRFDSSAEILSLKSAVGVRSTRGYAADLASATIDFKGGTVKSTEPVTVTLTSGQVKADSLSIVDGGATITFQGHVAASFRTPPPTAAGGQQQDKTP